MCRLNSFPRLTPWWRRCLTCSVASGDSLAVRSCCYRNHHLQTIEDGVGLEFVQVCVCNHGENRQLSGFCRQKSQSNTTLVISLSSSVSILTHRKNPMANNKALTQFFSFSSWCCAMKTSTIAVKNFFFAQFHLCQWIFVKLKVWSAKAYSPAKLGRKATREAFHSERSFIKTCFPGFSGFLLSHQRYRHSEETFFMAMCKNSVWKENSYILRLNTDSSYCSWPALDHTYRHSIKFSFFCCCCSKYTQRQQSLAHCIVLQH